MDETQRPSKILGRGPFGCANPLTISAHHIIVSNTAEPNLLNTYTLFYMIMGLNSVLKFAVNGATERKPVCLNSLSVHLLDLLQEKTSPDETAACHIRKQLLQVCLQADIGENKLFQEFSSVPFLSLYDRYGLELLGLYDEHAERWARGYLDSKGIAASSSAKLDLSFTQQKGDIKRVIETKFVCFEALVEHLRHLDKLAKLRKHFETTVASLRSPTSRIKRFVCLDIEAYEHSQRKLTEFGICTYNIGRCNTLEAHHMIIREHQKLVNKKFAPDAKHQFAFGESRRMSTSDAMAFLERELEQPGTALVGHALESDLRFLKRAHINCGRRINSSLVERVAKYDLQHLFRCREASLKSRKLVDICRQLAIPTVVMHNAGNDAAQTMAAFLRLIGLDTVVPRTEP